MPQVEGAHRLHGFGTLKDSPSEKGRGDDAARRAGVTSEGLIVVDGRGRIVSFDRGGRQLLATIGGLRQADLPVVSDSSGRAGLISFLRQAREASCGTAVVEYAGLVLRITTMMRPGSTQARLFAVSVKRGAIAVPSAERLRAEYRLSPTEARVALLLGQGFRLPQIADSLGITISTVRVHLRRVFKKTGARRQSAVVRLVVTARCAALGWAAAAGPMAAWL